MSFYSKNSSVQDLQLKVQELTVKLTDYNVVSTSGSTATINVYETITEVRSATFIDDSAGTGAPVTAANRTVSGTQVTLTLSAPFATNDSITIRYSVAE